MDENSIKPWQATRLREALFPAINYLLRLRRRMDKTGFLPTDRLYGLVCKAYDAMHALYTEVHYLSCKSGVGREDKHRGGRLQ
jgi:hypothetical protein